MPYKDPLKAKEYRKKWLEEHPDYNHQYEQQPRVKAVRKKYYNSPAGIISVKKYRNTQKCKETRKKYYKLPKIQEYHYKYRLANKNLSPKDYDKLLKEQNEVCAICMQPPKPNRRLCVDHDHRCCSGYKSCGKCIRGLLCDDCNHMLGSGKDSVIILQKAIEYLTLKTKRT